MYAAGYSLGSMILAKALTEPGGQQLITPEAWRESIDTAARLVPSCLALIGCTASSVEDAVLQTWLFGAGERIRGAVLVSNPCCMHLSTTRLAKTWSSGWVYGRLLAHRMKAYILEHWAALGKHQALQLVSLLSYTPSILAKAGSLVRGPACSAADCASTNGVTLPMGNFCHPGCCSESARRHPARVTTVVLQAF